MLRDESERGDDRESSRAVYISARSSHNDGELPIRGGRDWRKPSFPIQAGLDARLLERGEGSRIAERGQRDSVSRITKTRIVEGMDGEIMESQVRRRNIVADVRHDCLGLGHRGADVSAVRADDCGATVTGACEAASSICQRRMTDRRRASVALLRHSSHNQAGVTFYITLEARSWRIG